jgi:hypothetical protein
MVATDSIGGTPTHGVQADSPLTGIFIVCNFVVFLLSFLFKVIRRTKRNTENVNSKIKTHINTGFIALLSTITGQFNVGLIFSQKRWTHGAGRGEYNSTLPCPARYRAFSAASSPHLTEKSFENASERIPEHPLCTKPQYLRNRRFIVHCKQRIQRVPE